MEVPISNKELHNCPRDLRNAKRYAQQLSGRPKRGQLVDLYYEGIIIMSGVTKSLAANKRYALVHKEGYGVNNWVTIIHGEQYNDQRSS